jgi:6-phosphogluconolactonase
MEELTGSISVYKIGKDGFLSLLQNISGLPRDFNGAIGSADIHVSPDGRFLYCSNRGESNTIGILSINPSNGMLVWIDDQSTLGKTPRNFSLDPTGNFLLVANQNSDNIVIFKRDKQTGLLTDTGKRINVSKPVCLKWLDVE